MATFQSKVQAFIRKINETASNNNTPKWFKPFLETVKKFANDVSLHISELEGLAAVHKNVTDTLSKDRDRLQTRIKLLEYEIEDQEQYSRRNCLLVHGVTEKPNEDVEKEVMEIFQEKLEAEVAQTDISRMHRLGKKRTDEDKPRPIIVRFLSYRQRKHVFDRKKKLKGQRLLITENLTKKRNTLFKQCIEVYGKMNCWTLDGRIHCKSGGNFFTICNPDDLSRAR